MLSFDYTVSKLDTLKKSQQDSMTTREEVERKEAVAKLRIKQRAEVGYNSSLHTGLLTVQFLHTVSDQILCS